jgi:hypothetical protein
MFTYARNTLVLNFSGKSQNSSIAAKGDDKCAIFNAYLRLRTTWLYDLVELNFSFQREAATINWGLSLKSQIRVEHLALRTFFMDIYGRRPQKSPVRQVPSRENQEYLASIAKRLLSQAFHSGNASPGDVDSFGRTFIHVNA